MTTKLLVQKYLGIVLVVLMVACEKQTVNVLATSTPSEDSIISATEIPTLTAFPTLDASATSTVVPTATPLVNRQVIDTWKAQNTASTPVRTPVIPGKVEKFPSVNVKDGNLYYRYNTGQSVKLTTSGKDRDPILSDDELKIVFYRGEASDNLYSINSDGTQEQAIVTSETPLLIGKGEIKSPTFVPGTHILLINTYQCGPSTGLYDYPDCIIGVYSIDIDTGEINKAVENISGNSMRENNFEISPDGKYVSVAGAGHIDIYALSSGHFDIAYPNVITYYITSPDEYLPKQYWLPDSTGLIVLLTAEGESNEQATPPALYVAFRYIMKDKQAVQIPLDKYILWNFQADDWSISPDRTWILFAGNQTGNRGDAGLYYLGSLIDGNIRAYSSIGSPLSWYAWSPDSKHFALTNTIPGFIGSVDNNELVFMDGTFMEWIDTTHYYYKVIGEAADTSKIYIGEISTH